ncbi:MAG: A/G-specific adenine glycosylase [Bacteriovoracaceae bacterium]|nr:A/G-specific adenine glycosylase [Bacteriovoracaceae bacterium]
MNKDLIQWSLSEFSHLPWRANRSLYGTLVSEIMLQQTTVSTVLNHYERFLKEYPDTFAVANASDEQLTISWKGLGYYRRARNLKKACEYFCEHFNGEIPLDFEKLIEAPGIGDYTANALLAIGANKKALALDANLERVLARRYAIETPKGPKLLKELRSLFAEGKIAGEINDFGARNFNEALMDLGRNWCKARKASCELCPVSKNCKAAILNNPLSFPLDIKKKKESFNLTLLRVIVKEAGKLLVFKKSSKQWLSGQYEIPTFMIDCEDPKLKQYERLDDKNWVDHNLLPEYKTLITKYKITNMVLVANRCDLESLGIDVGNYEFKGLTNLNLSTASYKALELLEK